jgi:hypothetical protein
LRIHARGAPQGEGLRHQRLQRLIGEEVRPHSAALPWGVLGATVEQGHQLGGLLHELRGEVEDSRFTQAHVVELGHGLVNLLLELLSHLEQGRDLAVGLVVAGGVAVREVRVPRILQEQRIGLRARIRAVGSQGERVCAVVAVGIDHDQVLGRVVATGLPGVAIGRVRAVGEGELDRGEDVGELLRHAAHIDCAVKRPTPLAMRVSMGALGGSWIKLVSRPVTLFK